VQSGRKRDASVALGQLRTGFTKLFEWISTTAPQFKPIIKVSADPQPSPA
jgi:hypothetical protein